MAPDPHPRLVPVLLLCLLAVACGGGGGGGGGKSVGKVKGFGVSNGPSGLMLQGVNDQVVLVFSKKVDPATVSSDTVLLVTVADSTNQATAPAGLLASVSFEVIDNRVIVRPTIEFTQDDVIFGFATNALYEITFADPDTGASVTSTTGATLTNPNASFFFRTPNKAKDQVPGFPKVRGFLVDDAQAIVFPPVVVDDDNDNSNFDDAIDLLPPDADELRPPGPGQPILTVPPTPLRDLVFLFDDGVLPQSVVNSLDDTSPAVRVLVNTAPLPTFKPITAPGAVTFLKQQPNLTVVQWTPDLAALPPGGFLLVEIAADVTDLALNSKLAVTGDASPLLSVPLRVLDVADPNTYGVLEPFSDKLQEDAANTSATWGQGGLLAVLGGGRGVDGDLVVDAAANAVNPGATRVPLEASIDFGAKIVRLPVVAGTAPGVFEPRSWEFRQVAIPAGWVLEPLVDGDGDGVPDPEFHLVQSPGHPLDGYTAPLELRATGSIDVAGTVRVLPGAGGSVSKPASAGAPGYADYLAQGGAGGRLAAAAGDGGRGGDVLLTAGGVVQRPLVSPPVPFPGTAFEATDAGGKLSGVTGRSTALTATTLRDADVDLGFIDTQPELAAALAAGEIRLQPNVGVGASTSLNSGSQNQFIDENHPTFTVQSVTVDGGGTLLTIDGSKGQSMVEGSDNVGNGFAPIAATGDAYLVGRLAGAAGTDDAGLGRGGRGAEPYVVVNEGTLGVTTTGGGGGGGGGIGPGQDGGDSGPASNPAVNQRGTSGGISLDEAAGAAGGNGAPRGIVRVVSGTELDLVQQTMGTPLAGIAPSLSGARLVVGAPNDGWTFEIASFDGLTFTVLPLGVAPVSIDLASGPSGAAGPGLTAGVEVGFLVLPPAGHGGTGGGGSGVTVTGTVNSAPTVLPRLSPGAGGGSGGGAIVLEAARQVSLRPTGRVLAPGGDGGSVAAVGANLPGGGGGGGGSVTARAGLGFQLFQGGRFEVRGGSGGGLAGHGRGGDGGSGWLRFENFSDSLSLATFQGFTTPAIAGENLGRLLGLPQAVGQSRFYSSGVVNPEYERIVVRYEADTDGDGVRETGLQWRFDAAGVSGGAEQHDRPPFRFTFSPTGVNLAGFIDVDGASPTFYEASDVVSARTGLVYDRAAGGLRFSVGKGSAIVHGLGAAPDLALPGLPGVEPPLDMVSMAVGGVDDELFLLQRGTGVVFVVDLATGAYRRRMTLPYVLEGGIAVVGDGVDPAADRLLVAANHHDLIVTFPVRDTAAPTPSTTDVAPAIDTTFRVARDDVYLDLELTGLAHDPATDTLWCVDALAGTLLQVDLAPGSEGVSTSGVHGFARLTAGGAPFVPSSVAFDGVQLHLVRATGSAVTTVVPVAAAAVSLTGGELALGAGTALPEVARSIADGDIYLRFRITIDGTFVDELHDGGPVAFRDVRIDEIELVARNQGF